MFYANFLFTCGLVLSIYTSQHSTNTTYGTFMMVVSIIITLIGATTELIDDMKKAQKESRFKELESLVEDQTKQIQSLKEEVDILKRR